MYMLPALSRRPQLLATCAAAAGCFFWKGDKRVRHAGCTPPPVPTLIPTSPAAFPSAAVLWARRFEASSPYWRMRSRLSSSGICLTIWRKSLSSAPLPPPPPCERLRVRACVRAGESEYSLVCALLRLFGSNYCAMYNHMGASQLTTPCVRHLAVVGKGDIPSIYAG